MKKTFKFLSSVLLISTLGLVNCHKYETGGSATTGYIVGSYINSLIQSATTGNCAISLNLGSLYAGAILQGAVSNATNFTSTQFLSAAGATAFTDASLGYGGSSTPAATAYALVPYNKKYDAFLNTTTGWTEANRNSALAAQKAQLDSVALVGGVLILTSGVATAANQITVSAFYNSFSTAEKTAMTTTTTGVTTLSPAAANVAALDAIIAAASGTGLLGTAVPGYGGATALAAFGGNTTVSSAYLSRTSWRNGNALLACSRIPRSSCTLGAISSASLEADISGQIAVVDALLTRPECRKGTTSNGTSSTRIITAAFTGLDKNRTITLANGATYQNQTLQTDSTGSANSQNSDLVTAYFASEGGTTSTAFSNTLIASKAYPKSSALAQLGFTSAFPLATGTTAYPVTTGTAVATSQTAQGTDATSTAGSIPWYGGSNIGFSTVSSCENIGLGGVGPTPYTTSVTSTTGNPAMNAGQVDTAATSANRKTLTAVNEILYAFSASNAAATLYAALNGATYTSTLGAFPVTYAGTGQTSEDAISCNRSLRSAFTISAALNVGTKLPVINTASGDGASTGLLTACIYGGNTTSRTGAAAVLAGGSLLNITSCPAAAASASATFGEYGLQSFSTYPNGKL